MLNLKGKTSFKKRLACMMLSILTMASFAPLHVFASTSVASDSGDPNQYGTEAYWKNYFNVKTINYFDDKMFNGVTLDGDYTDGCGKKGVYFIKENHDLYDERGAIVITGDVTLIFVTSDYLPNGPTLRAYGKDASVTMPAGVGILIEEGNSLLVKGIGLIQAIGGNGAPGGRGGNGPWAVLSEDKWNLKAGDGGNGGYGGGGAAAAIGTGGSSGAAAPISNKNEFRELNHNFQCAGVESINGNDSSESTKSAGTFKAAGNVSIDAKAGESISSIPLEGWYGNSAEYIFNSSGYFAYYGIYDAGGGGGGGNGGDGFEGASIGSGGIGGASGGTGGSGSYNWGGLAYGWSYIADGGGGGGGAGSGESLGGRACTELKSFDNPAADGGAGSLKGGKGGAGTSGIQHNNDGYDGKTGGNGGELVAESGTSMACYSSTQAASLGSEDKYKGKSAKIYQAFPLDECKVVFKDSTGQENDTYKYTGEQIKPSISLVHIPTNTAIDSAAYTVEYGENISPDNPDKNYVTITSTGLGEHHVLMDGTMSKYDKSVTQKINFKIKSGVKIEYKSIQTDQEYNGKEVNLTPTVTNELTGEEVTDYKGIDTKLIDLKTREEVKEAVDVGEYRFQASLDPSDPKYTADSAGFETTFKIIPEKLIMAVSDDFKIEKEYDGTTDVTGYTGDYVLKEGTIYDRDNVVVRIDKKSAEYESPEYTGAEGKLGSFKFKLSEKIGKTSGASNGVGNYQLLDGGFISNVPFIIDQRKIEVAGGTAKDRVYEEGNKKVEITDISLLEEIPTTAKWEKDTDYTISEGTIDGDEAGDHTAQFAVTLPENGNYIFSNGGYEQDSETNVHITGRPVAPPTPSGTTFKYTGESQTYDVPGTDDYSVEDNTYTDVGQYTAKYSLTDANTEWSDPGVGRDPYEINWEIEKGAPQSVEQSMTVYPDQGLKKHKYQIRPSDLPIGMTRGIEYSVSEASEEYFKSCEVAKMTGLITFELTDKAIEEGQASLVLKIDSDNYEESTFTLTVNVGKLKPATLKGNIHPIDKDYDGQPAHIELTNLVLHDDTTGEEMPLSREQTKVLYVVGDDYVDTVKDAGRYETKIIVDEQLGYAAKLECGDLYTTISPRKVDVDGSGIAVDKVYDGTTAATITGSVAVGNVIEGDTVEAAPIHQDYASPNVQNTPTALGVELSGTDAHNYTAEGLTIPTNYVIEPAKLMLHEGKGIQAQRKYEYKNNKITFDINDMDITGFVGAETIADAKAAVEPTTLVESDTASAGEYPSVQYTVTLADDSNYVFDDGTREATGLGDAYIEKAEARDLGDINLTYLVNDSGEKEYQFDLSKLPKGMDEELAFKTVSKIDDNQIIESWSVDNNGLVHFTIAPNKADGNKALLNFETTSKNYADSPFRINIELLQTEIPQVTGLSARATDSKTDSIKWNKIQGLDEIKYEVWRQDGSFGAFKKIATTTSNAYKDTKVITGTKYTYKVRAFRTVQGTTYKGKFSNTDYAYPRLYKVTKLNATALNAASAHLTWNASGNKNVVYQIYRSNKPDTGFAKVGTITDGKTSFTQSFTPEQSGKKYYYKVRAITKDYTGKWHYGTFSKVDYAYPRVHAVAGFKAWAPNAKCVKVYFKALPDQSTKYWLYKSTKPTGDWGSPIAKLGCKDNLYTDKKVKAGHKYYYKLRPVEVINGKTYFGPYTDVEYAWPR